VLGAAHWFHFRDDARVWLVRSTEQPCSVIIQIKMGVVGRGAVVRMLSTTTKAIRSTEVIRSYIRGKESVLFVAMSGFEEGAERRARQGNGSHLRC
jgi:hypothetical protein